MKKLLVLLLVLCSAAPVFASQWFEIFEKKYIDIESINANSNTKIVSFWTKNLRKDPKDKFPDTNGKMVDYWYSINYWQINCSNKKSRIISSTVYDLKENPIYFDDLIPEWNHIVPDTYADGYYRFFCMVDFKENPLLNN